MAFVKTGGRKTFTINFEPEPCSNMTIQIFELDEESQKCPQGICNGISMLKINSKINGTKFVDCEEKILTKLDRRWYLEPADISKIGIVRGTKVG